MLKNDLFLCIKSLENIKFVTSFRAVHKQLSGDAKDDKVSERSLFTDNSTEKKCNFLGALLFNAENRAGMPSFIEQENSLKEEEFKQYSCGFSLFLSIYKNCILPNLLSLPKDIQKSLNPYAEYNINKKITGSFHDEEAEQWFNKEFKSSFSKLDSFRVLKSFSKESFIKQIAFEQIIENLNLLKEQFMARPSSFLEKYEVAVSSVPTFSLSNSDKFKRFYLVLLSIKISIQTFFTTLFSAIAGNELSIINEDNILNYSFSSSLLDDTYSFNLNESGIPASMDINTLILVNFDDKLSKNHYRSFGIPINSTIFLDKLIGLECKVDVCVLDDQLDPFGNFINNL